MDTFRVTLETTKGERWFLVEANSPESARTEALAAFPEETGKIARIEQDWETDFDPALHIDN